MKLGLVTYQIGQHWDIPTIIRICEATGFQAVELRTTHSHGVEPSLSPTERQNVRRQFENSKVRLLSLGSVCEFHSPDPGELRRNINVCEEFVKLAHDVGAVGVKVRPNAFPPGLPKEKTLEQIGRALRECGEFAEGWGVGIWLEVHGAGTCELPNIRKMIDIANHPNVGVCWNSNMQDVVDGSVRSTFALVKDFIRNVHINELWREDYPWRELFQLLKESGYDGYTLAEIPDSNDPERLLRYYRALWRELVKG